MILREMLEDYMDPLSVCLASMATDGLEDTSHILQLSAEKTGRRERIFVEGGDPVVTYQFTRIPADIYRFSAESPVSAWNRFSELAGEDGAVVACYNAAGFGRKMLESLKAKAGGQQRYVYIDIMLLAKCVRNRNCCGYTPQQGLDGLLAWLARRPFSRSIKYSMKDVCAWAGISAPEGELLVADANLTMLSALYGKLLASVVD